jgi:hypothetical protein
MTKKILEVARENALTVYRRINGKMRFLIKQCKWEDHGIISLSIEKKKMISFLFYTQQK